MTALHLGVQLRTTSSWANLRDGAMRAESLGYDSVWVPDHLVGWNSRAPILEAWVALAGLVGVTKRVALGPLVTPVSFRNPGLLAKMAATLDHASGGRAILGLGAGGNPGEHRAFGLPYADARERGRRLDEACRIVRALLDGKSVSLQGEFYRLADGRVIPAPQQGHLRLLIAGHSEGVLRAAARHADLWNDIALPDQFGQRLRSLRALIVAEGRDFATVMPTVSFRLSRTNERDAYRLEGDDEVVADALRRYLAAGARGFIVQLPPDDARAMARLPRIVHERLA